MSKHGLSRWALLVGIDQYFGKDDLCNLTGCCNDVASTKDILRSVLRVPQDHIVTLLSPRGLKTKAQNLPTRDRVLLELENISQKARPGDFVYLHYSGHGSQRRTAYPYLKGKFSMDEAICTLERDISDVELVEILESMVKDGGLQVCMVLDCCHSGGATRHHHTGDTRVRCRPPIDSVQGESAILPTTDIEADNRGDRNARNVDLWFYRPRNFVLIAACQPSELAREQRVNHGRVSGNLTRNLLATMADLGSSKDPITYGKLEEVLVSRCRSLKQQPMVLGAHDNLVFGSKQPLQYDLPSIVVSVWPSGSTKMTIDRGAESGILLGDVFTIYEPSQWLLGCPDAEDIAMPEIVVTSVGDLCSQATVREGSPWVRDIVAGTIGKLSERVSPVTVSFVPSSDSVRENSNDFARDFQTAFEQNRALSIHSDVDDSNVAGADFRVVVGGDLYLKIHHRTRQHTMSYIPEIRFDDILAPQKLALAVRHLDAYYRVLNLSSYSSGPPLEYQLSMTEEPKNEDNEDCLSSWAFNFKNLDKRCLYITIINLTPLYGVYPLHDDDWKSLEVSPGNEIPSLIIDIEVPNTLKHLSGRKGFIMQDFFKIIITTAKCDFRCYELPEITVILQEENLENGHFRTEKKMMTNLSRWVVEDRCIVTET